MIRLSVILATLGRDTLQFAADCAASQLTPLDELIIVGGGASARLVADSVGARWIDMAPGGDWGGRERTAAMSVATGTHLLFVDDDDALTPGAVATVRAALLDAPGRPHIFSMINVDGRVLPVAQALVEGNVGTPQLVAPNVPHALGQWGIRYECDFDFIASTVAHYSDGPVWHGAIIYGCREYGRRCWGRA